MKLKNILSATLAVTVISAAAATTAYAAEVPSESYGYLAGRQRSSDRHAQFGQVAELTTDTERENFFSAQDIGGGSYSDSLHLDSAALAAAGVIDPETAEAIQAYTAGKHSSIHGRYGSMEGLSPAERRTLYAGFDREGGDSISALLEAGIITQDQADAISAYLGR